jgi:hypothetical protein
MRPSAWIAGGWSAADTVKRREPAPANLARPRTVHAGSKGKVVAVPAQKADERDVATAA